MIVRNLDVNGDWTYGAGLNNYAQGQLAAQLIIRTRILSFLGDCFFDSGAGLNWLGYLGVSGGDNELALNLALSAVILNSVDENGNPIVLGLNMVTAMLNRKSRNLAVKYQAVTIYSTVTGAFTYDLNGLS